MDLVDEQDRLLSGSSKAIRCRGNDAPHFGHVTFHAADSNEFGVSHLGNDAGQRGFSAAGRSREYHRWQTICFDCAPQKFAGPENVLLTDKFLQRARTHASGERRSAVCNFHVGFFCGLEKIAHVSSYGALVRRATRVQGLQGAQPVSLRFVPAPDKLALAGMKSILVAIDFSDITPAVIDVARQIAKALDAEIHLVHVREFRAAAAPGSLGYGLAGMAELAPMSGVPMPGLEAAAVGESEDDKSKLVRWQTAIAQEDVKMTVHESTGQAAEEILSQADTVNAD